MFLRLRKAARKNRAQIFHIGQWTSPAVEKTIRPFSVDKGSIGTLLACPPGGETAAVEGLVTHAPDVAEGLSKPGAVILVGERAAQIPGLLTELVKLAEVTGARLAWIPRRAGERAALDAGAAPTLLPGGRLVADAAARAEVEQAGAWQPARCRRRRAATPPGSSRPRRSGALDGARGRRRRGRRPARPGARRGSAAERGFRGQPGAAGERGHRVRRRGPAGRTGRREVRHLHQLGGPPPRVRRHAREHRHAAGLPGARHARRRDGRRPVHPDPDGRRGRPRQAARGAAQGGAAGRGRRARADARREAKRSSRPGASCWTTGRCSPTSRTWPAPSAPPWSG